MCLLFLPVVSLANFTPIKLKHDGVMNVISYSEFMPISYGDCKGYEADLLRAIAELWHVKLKCFSENIYDGMWRLPSRPYTLADVAIGGFTPMSSRMKEGAVFSRMTTHFEQSLLIRRADFTSGKVTSYDSFKNSNMKIGVVPGTTGEQYAVLQAKEHKLPENVLIKYPSETELLSALKSGKVDAIARGSIGNDFQVHKNYFFMTIARRDFHEGFAFSVDKSNKALLQKLNQAILDVTNHGKITYQQWLKNHNIFLNRVQYLEGLQKNMRNGFYCDMEIHA